MRKRDRPPPRPGFNERGKCRDCGRDRILITSGRCQECNQEAVDRYRWAEKMKDWNGLAETQEEA